MSKSITFNADMIKALLAGNKTQTRRPIANQDEMDISPITGAFKYRKTLGKYISDTVNMIPVSCPLGKKGDTLWVRETFVLESTIDYHGDHHVPTDNRPIQKEEGDTGETYWLIPHYRATDPEPHIVGDNQPEYDDTTKWNPSIHMPQWASRITLKITDIRIERIQDISDDDAFKEGAECIHGKRCNSMSCEWGCTPAPFKENVWDKIYNDQHKPEFAWDKNPWVWVIGFKLQKRGLNT